jgi:hypothetical protein
VQEEQSHMRASPTPSKTEKLHIFTKTPVTNSSRAL